MEKNNHPNKNGSGVRQNGGVGATPTSSSQNGENGFDEVKPSEKVDFNVIVRVYKNFKRHYRPYLKLLAVAYLFLFATIGIAAAAPWPLKLILDQVILEEPLPDSFAFLSGFMQNERGFLLLWLSVSIFILALLKAITSYFNKYFVSACGTQMVADIRERVFAQLQRLSLSFHEKTRSGKLIYLITSDVDLMKSILVGLPQDLTHRAVTVLLFSVLMWHLDWRLCLMGLATLPLVYFVIKRLGKRMKAAMLKRREQEGEVASIVAENLTSMALIQAYGHQDEMSKAFNKESQESVGAQVQFLKLTRRFDRIVEFLMILGMTAIMYFGGLYAMNREISPGIIVLIMVYVLEIHGAVEKFNLLYQKLVEAQAAGKRLLGLVENEMFVEEQPDAGPAPQLNGHIEYQNVSFSYPASKEDVLTNVSFTVEPNETMAIVGPSGAGKSTIISLLLRFYDPQSGQILLDGQDIHKFTVKSVRDQITILMQDARLMQQSVYDNIAFGKPGATEEEVIAAAKLAEAHDFISKMPKGYKTPMDEGGENLSGGQKQRINIARAIIRDTPILILDEPATGVDAITEAKIQSALEHLMQNRTTLLIAHNLDSVVHADKILFLQNGEVANMGSHSELLESSQAYRELYVAQNRWKTDQVIES